MSDLALARFGAQVRTVRERLGMSQEHLAELCGIHRTYIGSVERGERNLGLLNIIRIAKALRIKASDLMDDIDKEDHNEPR